MTSLKKTILHPLHERLGAKLVAFGDWHMPISYQSVLKEHEIVRTAAGIFDVSHMGEIFVAGDEAEKFLQYVTINDVSRLEPGKGQYTAMLNEKGGMVDDLILYQVEKNRYLLCVNASNDKKDYDWLLAHAGPFDVTVTHESDKWSQIAIQGPTSKLLLSHILDAEDEKAALELAYTGILRTKFFGHEGYIARTGYTGEVGYELYISHNSATRVFEALLEGGAVPIGLGARDSLRLESCYLLYGNDMNDSVSPIEAGIGWATKVDKGDFIGREIVQQHKKEPTSRRKMLAFLMEDKGIARHDMPIFSGDKQVGVVTSGGFLPSLQKAGGLALISDAALTINSEVAIMVRGKKKLARLMGKPLYSAKVKS